MGTRHFALWLVLSIALLGCSDDDGGGNVTDAGADASLADADADASTEPRWIQIGQQVSPNDAESEDPTMMLLANGTPAVGYRHASFATNLQLWDGNSWGTTVEDPSNGQLTGSIYHAPAFCSDQNTVLTAYVLAGESSSGAAAFYDRTFVQRYTPGSGWQAENGGQEYSQPYNATEGTGYDAAEAAIACKPGGGDAVVAWLETDDALDLDRDAWTRPVSGGAASPRLNRVEVRVTDIRVADVALDDDGSVFVAHFEHDEDAVFSTQLFVTELGSAGWTALGDAIDTDADSNDLGQPALAAAGGALYLAWSADHYDGANRHVYVARWSGSEWTLLGGGPVSAFGTRHFDSSNPDLILVNGVPYLAWAESSVDAGSFIFVARWVADSWEIIGNQLNVDPARASDDPSLVASSDGSTLYLAFEENVDGHPQIFVKRYH